MSIKRLYQMVREIMTDMNEAYVAVFSAQAAFFMILSFFPFIMFLLTLIQYIPLGDTMLLARFYDMIPDAVQSTIILIVKELRSNATTTVTSITAITTLWSASKGFLGLVRGLNSVYHIKETRNYIKLRLISTVYTLVFTVLIIITLMILVFGNQIYTLFFNYFPELSDIALFVMSVRAAVSLTLLTLFFLLMFVFIPDRKTKILYELPGALIAAAGWLIFSFGYSFYIDNLAGFSSTYGSLTAMVLLMLWVYFCMYILFIGAELNVFMQKNGILIKKKK
ncbi:MAG: YihY/virulence factor BrkB family protein [bacterium]|nr:YihY/virulence factor BrkB family protein [bacterium]